MEILFGRLHPLLVHFPIALLLLLFLLEIAGLKERFKSFLSVRPFLLVMMVLSVWATVLAGLQLFNNDSYGGEVALQHKNGGILMGVGITLLAVLYGVYMKTGSKKLNYAYWGILSLTTAGMIYTSHLGGTLTHGEDFLALPDYSSVGLVKASLGSSQDMSELKVYHDLIRPVLKSRCMSCHNEHKSKGNFQMHTWDALVEGGDSGKPILVSGMPDSSELFHRMVLPLEDDEHMPPSGKPQLDTVAIKLIEWWIAEGADPAAIISDSTMPASIKRAVQTLLPAALQLKRSEEDAREERLRMQKELDKLAQKLHVDIRPDPERDSVYFALSLRFPPAYFSDEHLAALIPYAEAFSKVSLPGAEISDDGLFYLSQLTNLRELYIPKTCINGSGLVYLQALDSLEVLNISETAIDEKCAFYLLNIPALKEVYLYQTPIGLNIIQSMDEYLEEVSVTLQQGPYF